MKLQDIQEASYGTDPLITEIKSIMTNWGEGDWISLNDEIEVPGDDIDNVIHRLSKIFGKPSLVRPESEDYFAGADWDDIQFNGTKWSVYTSKRLNGITVDVSPVP